MTRTWYAETVSLRYARQALMTTIFMSVLIIIATYLSRTAVILIHTGRAGRRPNCGSRRFSLLCVFTALQSSVNRQPRANRARYRIKIRTAARALIRACVGPHCPQRPSIHYTIAVAPPRPAYVPTMPAAYGEFSQSALPALAGPNFECQQVFADNVLKAGDYISLGISVSSPTSLSVSKGTAEQ